MVRSLGHSLSPPLPSLFSLRVQDAAFTALAGLTVPGAAVTLLLSGEERALVQAAVRSGGGSSSAVLSQLTQRGPLMITHQGECGGCFSYCLLLRGNI